MLNVTDLQKSSYQFALSTVFDNDGASTHEMSLNMSKKLIRQGPLQKY